MTMRRKHLRDILGYLKDCNGIIGYFVIAIPLVIAFFSVDLSTESIILNILLYLLIASLILGMLSLLPNCLKSCNKIKFDYAEMGWLVMGVLTTYSINHFLSVNIILAASSVGLLGHLFIKKYQVAVYCGAFAGMVSLTLFNFLEVGILAVVCAFVYSITKNVFKGFGGKLGFVAFMSSFIIHDIFNEDFLPGLVEDLNFTYILIASILGGTLSYLINHYTKAGNVVGSSLPTLFVSILMIYVFKDYLEYLPIFFAGTFVGMSSKKIIGNFFFLLLACGILAYIYNIFEHEYIGLGGKLGFMAIYSVLMLYGLVWIKNLMTKNAESINEEVI